MNALTRNDPVTVQLDTKSLPGRVVYTSYSGKIGVKIYPRDSNPYLILVKQSQVVPYRGTYPPPILPDK